MFGPARAYGAARAGVRRAVPGGCRIVSSSASEQALSRSRSHLYGVPRTGLAAVWRVLYFTSRTSQLICFCSRDLLSCRRPQPVCRGRSSPTMRSTHPLTLLIGVLTPARCWSFSSGWAAPGSRHAAACAPSVACMSLLEEVSRRRNLAIISHPDAGKTTLTEKLLLYGGAINQAGAVKAKGEQRRATSDFMQIEQDRGISISSTVLTYDYKGKRVNVLDTPGHQDFSEDTYRTLAAADNAVMLVDGAKGLEPQTRKLFEVARLRRLPLFTFVNKLDRPALSPFEIIDQIEAEFGVVCCPLLWPIGCGDRFKGVLDRRDGSVHLVTPRPCSQILLPAAAAAAAATALWPA
eukprot:3899228-Prymnesium_polylepis.2